MKMRQHDAGHMAKMAAIPIYGKHIKNLLFMNHWANFDETKYETSATQAHYIMVRLRPLVDIYLFYGEVEFCNWEFYIEE